MTIYITIFIFVIIIIYFIYQICNTTETFVSENETTQSINGIDDSNAINTLAQISKQLMTGGLTVPGDINISGNTTTDGDMIIRGNFGAGSIQTGGNSFVGGNSTVGGNSFVTGGDLIVRGRNILAELDRFNKELDRFNKFLDGAQYFTLETQMDNGSRHMFMSDAGDGRGQFVILKDKNYTDYPRFNFRIKPAHS